MAFLHEKQTVNTGTKNYWVKLDDMLNILESITVNVIMVLYGGFDQLLVPHTHCILPMYRVIFLQRIKYKRYKKCLEVMFRSRCNMRSFMPMKFAISPHYTIEFVVPPLRKIVGSRKAQHTKISISVQNLVRTVVISRKMEMRYQQAQKRFQKDHIFQFLATMFL